jgi:hypothetical protein
MTDTTLVLTGTLTEADHKGHVPVRFAVPEGTTRLSGTFRAVPERARGALFDNLISLSIFGPDGPRGARHNNPDMDFALDAGSATPGYTAGAIEAGIWTVWMDTFRIAGPDPVIWRLELSFGTGPVASQDKPAAVRPVSRGRRWYRGDLHAHSLHSDASWDIPDLVAWARDRGLDFVTLTDHNTTSGHDAILALGSDDLLTMGGCELTTHHGHALSLGRREWEEWRVGPVTGLSMPQIAERVIAGGAVFVIAHPMSEGDPGCTGCRWEYADMQPGPAGAVEIWNGGPWSDYNEQGLALYRRWLAEGHRIVATAGSDIHGLYDSGQQVGLNHVDADDLSEAAILAAVGAGRNYLSSGPTLILSAAGPDGETIGMGGTLRSPSPVTAEWVCGETQLVLNFVGPSGILASHDIASASRGRADLPEPPSGFVMAELRDREGRVHAVTNPIFIAD